MSVSSLASLILARTLRGAALADQFSHAFSADSLHFITANNDQCISDAIRALPATKKGTEISGAQYRALGDAIGQGMAVMRSALPDGRGWVGAKLGAFSKASADSRAPYLAAHAAGVALFREVLGACPDWQDKAEKSAEEKQAEKAKREAEKAEKRAELVAEIVAEQIASGRFIVAGTVKGLGDASAAELVAALRDVAAMPAELVAELAELVAELAEKAKKAEREAEKAEKVAKAEKAKKAKREAERAELVAEKPATQMTEPRAIGDQYAEPAELVA